MPIEHLCEDCKYGKVEAITKLKTYWNEGKTFIVTYCSFPDGYQHAKREKIVLKCKYFFPIPDRVHKLKGEKFAQFSLNHNWQELYGVEWK